MKALRTLDRYVLGSWLRIFVLTALGFPLVSILINLTDMLQGCSTAGSPCGRS